MKTRPLRELKFDVTHPRLVYYPETYHGNFVSSFVIPNPPQQQRTGCGGRGCGIWRQRTRGCSWTYHHQQPWSISVSFSIKSLHSLNSYLCRKIQRFEPFEAFLWRKSPKLLWTAAHKGNLTSQCLFSFYYFILMRYSVYVWIILIIKNFLHYSPQCLLEIARFFAVC